MTRQEWYYSIEINENTHKKLLEEIICRSCMWTSIAHLFNGPLVRFGILTDNFIRSSCFHLSFSLPYVALRLCPFFPIIFFQNSTSNILKAIKIFEISSKSQQKMQMDCFGWVKMMWVNKIHTTNKRNALKLKEEPERTKQKQWRGKRRMPNTKVK